MRGLKSRLRLRRLTAPLLMACCAVSLAAASPAYRWRLPDGAAPPPVPADNPMSAAKVELGHRLFYDADLSIDGTMACATCHEQRRAFSDGNRTHGGVSGDPGRRNVMTLANAGYFRSLTWGDPHLQGLEGQVAVPVLGGHPVEMGLTGHEAALAERLGADACYHSMFAEAFPEDGGAITMRTVSKALAAFTAPESIVGRVKRQQGPLERGAIPAAAKRGAALFFGHRLGCASCHAAPTFTDAGQPNQDPIASFHDIGLYDRKGVGGYPSGDRGLAEITGKPEDEGRFRTPSLRNVALTAPYMHDGSAATLQEAIIDHRMSGVAPTGGDVADLVAFLQSLTDRRFVSDPGFALPKTRCGKSL